MDLRTHLKTELERRQRRNPRYSLRGYARSLGVHHTTLSRIFGRRRRLTSRSIRQLGQKLGLSARQIAEVCINENCALILGVAADKRFRADARWIAMVTGIAIDDVEVALHRLLHDRRIIMKSRAAWTAGER